MIRLNFVPVVWNIDHWDHIHYRLIDSSSGGSLSIYIIGSFCMSSTQINAYNYKAFDLAPLPSWSPYELCCQWQCFEAGALAQHTSSVRCSVYWGLFAACLLSLPPLLVCVSSLSLIYLQMFSFLQWLGAYFCAHNCANTMAVLLRSRQVIGFQEFIKKANDY